LYFPLATNIAFFIERQWWKGRRQRAEGRKAERNSRKHKTQNREL
jgi:hypothetical protein